MNKYIAVTIGDINGIGMEILIKSWKKKQIQNFIIFTKQIKELGIIYYKIIIFFSLNLMIVFL